MDKTALWTNEYLDKMRFHGDPVADAAATALFQDEGNPQVFRFLKELARNDSPISPDLDPRLQEYFEKTGNLLCTKEEEALLEESVAFFDKHGFRILGMLFFKSLPTGYMCEQPAKVLHETKLLEEQATRRVLETAQFIFDVSNPGWYKPEGSGIRAIQKVRLIHAGMRHMILKDLEEPWDQHSIKDGVPNGVPINQVDKVLTCQLFSLAVLDGLKKMGVEMTAREQEAHFFHWKVVGLMLGIEEEIMPDTVDEGWLLQNKIYDRQINAVNQYGKRLNDALMDVIAQHTGKFIDRERLQDVEVFFIDNQKIFNSLGIPEPTVWDKLKSDIIIHLISAKEKHHEESGGKLPMRKHGLLDKVFHFISRLFGYDTEKSLSFKMDAFEYLCKSILASMTRSQETSVASGSGEQGAPGAPFVKIKPAVEGEVILIRKWELEGWNI